MIAFLSQKAQSPSELHALLTQEKIATPALEAKAPVKEAAPAKSYLPDPTKKKDKRPFPKRKAILLILILALVAALLFWLIETGVIPLPNIEPEKIDAPITPESENQSEIQTPTSEPT